MAVNATEYMEAAGALLGKLEKSSQVSKNELESVRVELARGIRGDATAGAPGMQTLKVGSAKVLVPNLANTKLSGLVAERSRKRFTNFRLNYLSPDQVQALSQADTTPKDTRKFIRHSRRLARNAREFLARIQELEPDLAEETREALKQINDNDMDLLKLEAKSFTRMRETWLRGINGKKQTSEVVKELEAWDLNRNLWNLSLLEHPKASVRNMLANASERMGSRTTTKISRIPKRSFIMVAPTPAAEKKMTKSSRTASLAWRVFSVEDLDNRWKKLPKGQNSPSSWRGLGLGFNTPEWYIPVPPEIATGVSLLAAERRRQLFADIERLEEQAL